MRCAEGRMKEAEDCDEWEVVGKAESSLTSCMQENNPANLAGGEDWGGDGYDVGKRRRE